MGKTVTVQARVEPGLKAQAETVLTSLGLDFSTTIKMLLRQVVMRGGLPFDVSIPNDLTRQTLKDAEAGVDVVRTKSTDEMFAKLGI